MENPTNAPASTQQGATYNVDLVMCIDTTSSMTPVIDRVKSGALSFHKDLREALNLKQKIIDNLRVKVIDFRDFYCDGEISVRESPFFKLPEDAKEFEEFVNVIRAQGGGDIPECGLEALAMALQSDWSKEGDKQRHVVAIYTDAPAHPLEKDAGRKPRNYPQGIPSDFDALSDAWEEGMQRAAKRLKLMAPDAYPWTDIFNDWDAVMHVPSSAGDGLEELTYKEIIDNIAGSI